jgi:hypothetical protein
MRAGTNGAESHLADGRAGEGNPPVSIPRAPATFLQASWSLFTSRRLVVKWAAMSSGRPFFCSAIMAMAASSHNPSAKRWKQWPALHGTHIGYHVKGGRKRFWKGCKPSFVCALASGENHLSQQPVPGTRSAFADAGAGRSRVPYLALHPMGFSVPPRLRLERWALTPPFHPCLFESSNRSLRGRIGGLFSVALSVGTPRGAASRVYFDRDRPSYAASRPAVIGLSSPGSRRKRFSTLPKPG